MSLQVKGRIDARNSLETYCYNMKSTIEDKLGDKVSDEQKDTVCSFSPDMNLLAACHLLTGSVLPESTCMLAMGDYWMRQASMSHKLLERFSCDCVSVKHSLCMLSARHLYKLCMVS